MIDPFLENVSVFVWTYAIHNLMNLNHVLKFITMKNVFSINSLNCLNSTRFSSKLTIKFEIISKLNKFFIVVKEIEFE